MKPIFKCKNCNVVIDATDEPEFSEELCEVFCEPDCAKDYYFEHMRSTPIELEDLAKRYPDGK